MSFLSGSVATLLGMDLYSCRRCEARFVSLLEERTARCLECDGWLARVWMPEGPSAEPGSYPDGPDTSASLDEFIRADPARLPSREVDFGVLWRERSSASRSYRAAWIEETGELYVVQAGPRGDGGGHVEVLGTTDRAGVESAPAGLAGPVPARGLARLDPQPHPPAPAAAIATPSGGARRHPDRSGSARRRPPARSPAGWEPAHRVFHGGRGLRLADIRTTPVTILRIGS